MKKIIYPAIKSDDTDFRIINSKLFKAELNALKKGRYRVIVETYRKEKSHPQLKWLFGQVYPLVLRGLIDAGFEEFTNLDQVDAYCKSMFAKQEIVNRNSGEVITVPALKREMSTVQFSTYVDAVRNWALEYLGVTIPDPENSYTMEL